MTFLRGTPKAAAALVLHVGLVLWLTWPLASVIGTHLPATAPASLVDPLLVGFTLAHESRSLVSDPGMLPHAPMFYPAPWALYYGEASFGALPLFAGPFLLSGNPTLALNVVLLAGLSLTAWMLHVATAARTKSWLGGVIAGWTFLTTPFVFSTWLPVAANYAVMFWLPAIMLLGATPMLGARSMVAMFALVVFQGLTSVYFIPAVTVPLGIVAMTRLARPATRAAGVRLAVVIALALGVLTGVFWGHVVVRRANPELSSQTVYPWIGLHRLPLPFGALADGQPGGIPAAGFLVIAVGGLLLGFRALRSGVAPSVGLMWAHAALWAVAGMLMASLSLRAASHVPALSAVRARSRFAIDTLMGLSMLCGLGFAEIARLVTLRRERASRGWLGNGAQFGIALLLGAAMYLGWGRTGGPQPRDRFGLQETPTNDGAIMEALRGREGPLLELPTGQGLRPHAVAMYRAIFHRLPLLNGYHGYWPQGFSERMALACRLPDDGAMAELVRQTGVSLILVHTAILGPPPGVPPNKFPLPYGCPGEPPDGRRGRWLAIGQHGGNDRLRLVASDGADLLFAVE